MSKIAMNSVDQFECDVDFKDEPMPLNDGYTKGYLTPERYTLALCDVAPINACEGSVD